MGCVHVLYSVSKLVLCKIYLIYATSVYIKNKFMYIKTLIASSVSSEISHEEKCSIFHH